jgi:hypothetical protein
VDCNNGKTILAHLPQLHAELQYKLRITDQQNTSDERLQSRASVWLMRNLVYTVVTFYKTSTNCPGSNREFFSGQLKVG